MASLKSLLGSRNFTSTEQNLEKGTITSYMNGTMYSKMCNGFCFIAPGAGTVTIDSWGAGGSGARMCCCGGGLPGNSGAYTRKQINMSSGQRVCGCLGKSCGNASSLCFRGCSEPTMWCWFSSATSGCVCTQGGRGGTTWCSTGSSLYCCFRANGFCTTNRGPNCGLVCNCCNGSFHANSYGGDINCCSRLSCASYLGCYPACTCMHYYHVATPAGVLGKDGANITYAIENDNPYSRWSGQGIHQFSNALNAASKSPSRGVYHGSCWMGNRSCQCYEQLGCGHFVPYGTGGPAAIPCPGVRDHGWRGGDGAVRIKYVEG
mgnify:CR=1 FL=1